MPDIPTFVNRSQAPIEPSRAFLSPEAMALPGRAQTLTGQAQERAGLAEERFAPAADKFGEALGALGERAQYQYVADNWSDATTKWHDQLLNRIDEANQTGNYQGFARQLKGDLDADLQQRLENAPTPYARTHLERHFATLADTITSRATTYEHGAEINAAQAGRLQNFDDASKLAYRDPSTASDLYAQGMARIAGDASAGLINPERRQKEEKAFGDTLWTAHLLGRAERDPIGAMGDLNAGKYDQYLDPKSLEALKPRLQNATAKGIIAGMTPGMTTTRPGAAPSSGDGRFSAGSVPLSTPDLSALGSVMAEASKSLPAGYRVVATSGDDARPQTPGSYHPQGKAMDVQIIGPNGPVPNRGEDTTGLYTQLAAAAYNANQQLFPGSNLAWGGRFETEHGSGVRDIMHFDRGPDRGTLGPPLSQLAATHPAAQPGGPTGSLATLFQRIDKMNLDPEVALKVKAGLRTNYDAIEADELRQQRLHDKAVTEASDAAEKAIIADAKSDHPQITAKDIANDPRLKPDAQLRMLGFVAKDGQVDPGISHQTAIGLMQGIGNGTVTDHTAIIDEFNQGKLNWTDFDHLNKQVDDLRTAGGEVLAKRREELIKSVTPQIDPKASLGVPDPQAQQKLYNYRWLIDEKVDEYRKDGKNPADLFDPSKPEFLGKKETLQPFASPLLQRLSDVAAPGGEAPALSSATTLAELQAVVAKNPSLRQQAIAIAVQKGWIAAPPPAAPQPQAPMAR